MPWCPTTFIRFVEGLSTSTSPVRIETDQGDAFVKVINNRLGPQVLARELISARLAQWLGLRTFDFAVLEIGNEDEIWLSDGKRAEAGPAFATRRMRGHAWGGSVQELSLLDNPQDTARLVVFDTWLLNPDRCHPDPMEWRPRRDNVFLTSEGAKPGHSVLLAMDHSECLAPTGRDLNKRVADIERVKDRRIFGLFPEFEPYVAKYYDVVMSIGTQLSHTSRPIISDVIGDVPKAWMVDSAVRDAIVDFIYERAKFLSDRIAVDVCFLRRQGDVPFNSERRP